MNGALLALLRLAPGETGAVPLLHQFAADHPGVRIVEPHWHDEPWRAEIAEGKLPGEGARTSRVVGADWPSGLLAKLHEVFPSGRQAPPGGNQPGDPDG